MVDPARLLFHDRHSDIQGHQFRRGCMGRRGPIGFGSGMVVSVFPRNLIARNWAQSLDGEASGVPTDWQAATRKRLAINPQKTALLIKFDWPIIFD
ncbi:hypothetical protein [Altericroceibacterium spongiae]|uniref:hypothetical protein n=1 Tax=Altericroceibacterium spongiae TaxID=2320269 RepID=UPI0011C34D7D|nr:hypothetical protein [Altericroceibacterium spongiae]